MWILWIAFALTAAKLIGWGVVADLSWWWVGAVYAFAFVWFEAIEKLLGLDRKKAFNEMEAARNARIERSLRRDPNRKNR